MALIVWLGYLSSVLMHDVVMATYVTTTLSLFYACICAYRQVWVFDAVCVCVRVVFFLVLFFLLCVCVCVCIV